MGLFDRKKNKKDAAKEVQPAAEKSNASAGPSIKNVKIASAPAADAKSAAKTPAKTAAKPTAKAPAKPVAKAPAKSTAAKAPTKAPSAAKVAPKPTAAKVTPAPATSPRPFFAPATEEDIRMAFDQAIAEADAEILKSSSKAVGK